MKTAGPLLSVVVPLYNGRRYVEGLLRSIRAQGVAPLEILIVDDGSRDGTAACVARRKEPDVRLIRLRHAGPCAATNAGLRAARGKYVAVLEMDDLWYPWKSREQIRLMERRPELAWSATEVDTFDRESGRILKRGYVRGLKSREFTYYRAQRLNLVFTSTVMFRRRELEKTGCFDERYKYYRYESEFFLKLGRTYGPRRAGFLRKACVLYNVATQEKITSLYFRQFESKKFLSEQGRELLLDEAFWRIRGGFGDRTPIMKF